MPYHDHLYYEVEGAGRPLLLLHCPGLSGLYWRPILDRLDGRFLAVTPDLPGHGRSGDRTHLWSYPEIVDRVIGLVDHLGLIGQAPILVGYSSTATIALMAAARVPKLWGGVAAISVPAYTLDIKLKVALGEMALRRGKSALIGQQILRTNHANRAHYHLLVDYATGTSPLAYTAFFRETPRWDPLAFASQITVPVRLIHGRRDRWSRAHTEQLARALPQGSLWWHPRSDHRIPTREPDWVAAELLTFGAQLDGASNRKL